VNLGQYFSYHYDGGAFVQGGIAHLSAILVIIVMIFAAWRFPFSKKHRWVIRIGMAFLLLVNEIFWHLWHAYFNLWTLQTLLPLNLCNLMVIVSVLTLITRNQIGYEFIYLLGIPAAMQVLITPALGSWGFPHILFFQIFISHGGIVFAALFLTLSERMQPEGWGAVRRVVLWATLYAAVIFILNQYLGSNYLFLAYKPPAVTLLDYIGPWPWYIISMEVIGLLLVVVLYLPFHLKRFPNEQST
jgi:hypothetical integral membrane protein (TIGR02206 family)